MFSGLAPPPPGSFQALNVPTVLSINSEPSSELYGALDCHSFGTGLPGL